MPHGMDLPPRTGRPVMPSTSAILDRDTLLTRVRTETLHSVYAQPGWISVEVAVGLRLTRKHGGRAPTLEDDGPRALRPRLAEVLAAHDAPRIPQDLRLGEPILLKNGDTFEIGPGNQLIYRSPPFHDPTMVVSRIRLVLGGVLHRLRKLDVVPVLQGAMPHGEVGELPQELTGGDWHERLRQLHATRVGNPDRLRGHQGLIVRLHPGIGDDAHARFLAAERLAPVLAAAFANSPLEAGRPTRHVSRRLAEWMALEPLRTRPFGFSAAEDPAETVLSRLLRTPHLPHGMTLPSGAQPPSFAQWIDEPERFERAPDLRDWTRHAASMWCPVTPRGALDLAITDTVEMRWMPVPLLLWWALLWGSDPRQWHELPEIDLGQVAERGTRVPGVVLHAHRVFDEAIRTMEMATEPALPAELVRTVQDFRARYLDQGRMPADDLIDQQSGEAELGAAT